MTAYNVVRFRVKPGRDEDFISAHKTGFAKMKRPRGARKFSLVKTGDGVYVAVGEWNKFDDIVAARPMMIGSLDNMRDLLEDMGGGLGVTDPVSGSVVFEMSAAGAAPKKRAKAKKAPTKKAAKKKAPARKPAKKAKKKKRGRR